MKYIFIVIFFLSVCSCTTQRKAERYLNENKEFAASYCAAQFKVNTDTIKIYDLDTIRFEHYINSIDTIVIDTSHSKENIITQVKYRIKEIIKQTPPITITKIVEKENTANIERLKIVNDKLTTDNALLSSKVMRLTRFKLYTFLIAFLIAAAACIYFYFKAKK
jgi:hypothetical protein